MLSSFKPFLWIMFAFTLLNSTAWAQEFPIEAGSWGGNVRTGPGMEYDKAAALQNGEAITLLEETSSEMNGYSWFKIEYGGDLIGYQWGGIICGIGDPIDGTFQACPQTPNSITRAKLSDNSLGADVTDEDRLDKCVAAEMNNQRDGSACIGMIADPCLNQDDIFSTLDLRQCISLESEIWDARLNVHYKALMATLKDDDQKTALRDMQRLWISYTQKFCGLEYEFYKGTLYLVSGDHCVMKMTAKQSIALRNLKSGH